MSNEEFLHLPKLSSDPITGSEPLVTEEKISEAVSKMKNSKATGTDNIPSESKNAYMTRS